jgi:hypothetical protein
MMQIVEQYISGDGLLNLIVCSYDDGDTTLGFEGYAWHTHADILASLSGLPEPEAVRRFVNDILDDRSVIAVSRIGAAIRDVWVTDNPVSELKYKPDDERIEFRYWSGRRVSEGV